MPNFSFHIRHGIHSRDHNVHLPDARAAQQEATIILGDMARDVADADDSATKINAEKPQSSRPKLQTVSAPLYL
jgi:hypothetical protein